MRENTEQSRADVYAPTVDYGLFLKTFRTPFLNQELFMTSTRRTLTMALAVALTGFAASSMAQTKWDLPAAYPATNFHTENIAAFAADVDKATGGKLKITVHPGASLFKAPEIKRAVQGGQAQIGEILLVNFGNEDPIYEADGIPFLATGYDGARKLYVAQKPMLEARLAKQGMMLLYDQNGKLIVSNEVDDMEFFDLYANEEEED